MKYTIRFGLYNLIFNIAIQTIVARVLVNVLLAFLYNVFPTDDTFIYDNIRVVLSSAAVVTVYIISIKESAKYACKKSDIPEYTTIKRFSIIYFGIMSVLQLGIAIHECSGTWNHMNSIIKQYGSVISKQVLVQNYISFGIGIVAHLVIVISTIYMISLTLREYDNY